MIEYKVNSVLGHTTDQTVFDSDIELHRVVTERLQQMMLKLRDDYPDAEIKCFLMEPQASFAAYGEKDIIEV